MKHKPASHKHIYLDRDITWHGAYTCYGHCQRALHPSLGTLGHRGALRPPKCRMAWVLNECCHVVKWLSARRTSYFSFLPRFLAHQWWTQEGTWGIWPSMDPMTQTPWSMTQTCQPKQAHMSAPTFISPPSLSPWSAHDSMGRDHQSPFAEEALHDFSKATEIAIKPPLGHASYPHTPTQSFTISYSLTWEITQTTTVYLTNTSKGNKPGTVLRTSTSIVSLNPLAGHTPLWGR